MTERTGQEPSGDYFDASYHGTTEADLRHVSPAEATEALDIGEREEELPEPDERFERPTGSPGGRSSAAAEQ